MNRRLVLGSLGGAVGVAVVGAVVSVSVPGAPTLARAALAVALLGLVCAGALADALARADRRRRRDLARRLQRQADIVGRTSRRARRRIPLGDPVGGSLEPGPLLDDEPQVSLPVTTAEEPYAAIFTGQLSRRSSYMYKLAESKRRLHLARSSGGALETYRSNEKLAGYRVAQRCGVAVPQVHSDREDWRRVDFDALPDRCVLKPCGGAGNRGVRLLERREPGVFHELITDRSWTAEELRSEHGALVSRGLVTARVFVEELLAPRSELADRLRIPDDLKVWCFEDRPALVMQRRMGRRAGQLSFRFKFWSAQWVDLGPVKYRDRIDPALKAPAGGDEVLAAAARIGRELAVPFVRLDLYDTDHGPVFGEISPHPGPPEVFRRDVDEQLGREWELAEARLQARGRSWVYRPEAP